MNKKLKHLKKFNSKRLNEELSSEQIVTILQALTLTQPSTTISLQQAMQYGNPQTQFDIKISIARTTDHDVYYNMTNPAHNAQDVQDNLPPMVEAGVPVLNNKGEHLKDAQGNFVYKKTRTLKGRESDYLRAIKEGKEVLHYFKYISDSDATKAGSVTKRNSQGTDITDFLKVGDKKLNEKGSLVIDLTDGKDEEIIVSGNGIYLLVRTAANNQQQFDKQQGPIKMNVVQMRSVTGKSTDAIFKDTDFLSIKTNSDKTSQFLNHIHYLFQISSPIDNEIVTKNARPKELVPNLTLPSKDEVYRINGGLHGLGSFGLRDGDIITDAHPRGYTSIIQKAPTLGQQRDDLVIDAIQFQLFTMNDWFFPSSIDKQMEILRNKNGIDLMSREDIQNYLDKFKAAKTKSERNEVIKGFIDDAMQDYKENFMKFVDEYSSKIGLSKQDILGEFDIEKSIEISKQKIKSELDAGKVYNIWGISGVKGVDSKPNPAPKKKIETGETQVKVGETKYQIRAKTTSIEKTGIEDFKDVDVRRGTAIKKESFKYIKTFENFKY